MTLREFIQDSLLLERSDGKSILDSEVAIKMSEKDDVNFINLIKNVSYKDGYVMIDL